MMTFTKSIRERVVEQITVARSEREEFELFVRNASDELGGICFIGPSETRAPEVKKNSHGALPLQVACKILRVIEFVLVSMFSEHLAARRWNRAAVSRNVY